MKYSIDSFPGRTISANGRSYVYFGGTSYLGLQTNLDFQNLFIENVKKYGTNYGASRKSNIQISIFSEIENYLANLIGSESCTTTSSGYLAGQLVAQTFNTEKYALFYAPGAHDALHVSFKKPFDSFDTLNKLVREHLHTNHSTPVVFLDTLDTEGLNYPTFEHLKKLPLEQIILIADDSHGIGIIGERGQGVFEEIEKLKPKELLVCCSLGKGFGVQAGAIFSSQKRMNQLIRTEFFGGASPAMPAALATLIQGGTIFEKQRIALKNNILLFQKKLEKKEQFQWIPNYPVYNFSNPKLVTYLESNGILITNFRYPTEKDLLMSRIVLSAAHKKKDILRLTDLINRF